MHAEKSDQLPDDVGGTAVGPRDTSPQAPAGHGRTGNTWLYPVSVALSTLVLGLVSSTYPVAGVIGAVGAGVLCLLGKRLLALLVVAGMLGALVWVPPAGLSSAYWTLIGLLLVASVAPLRIASSLLRVAPATWAVCLVLLSIAVSGLLLQHGPLAHFFVFAGCLCSALLGAGLTRHLAMVDARVLAWGEDGLEAVTRDLLLGRITSGMLHDLSQPLNVISMASGNLGYIAEHLETDEATRKQLLERIGRISAHTENTAAILSLFRWFGRNTSRQEAELTVRNALERAIAASRSNVRYQGVEVELEGNGLDLIVADHHGRLEMMAVAALLSGLGAYGSPDGERSKGRIVIHAVADPSDITIEIHCIEEHGQPIVCKPMDNATLWLIGQVARAAGGDFRCATNHRDPVQFVIRLEREGA